MDKKTTVAELRKWANKVRDERNWHPDAKSLAISIVLEAGELLEHFQWSSRKNTEAYIKKNKEKMDDITMELGDVLNYMCEFADRMNIDLSDALKKTLEKVEKKYPVEGLKKGGDKFYFEQKKKYRQGKK